eukprot:gene9556-6712_t
MQAVLSQIHAANMKAMLISRMNFILLSVNAVAGLVLIIVWAVEWAKEGGGFLSRYVACIIALLFLVITNILSILVHRSQPRLSLFYAHQVFAVLTLLLTAVSMGMNNVVVDLCRCNEELQRTRCGAHLVELLADLTICLAMVAAYLTTQQRVVTFIDKGILDGIKGRSNGMTELP